MSASTQSAGEASLDIVAVVRQLWAHRWRIAISTLVVGAAFAIYAFVATPVFRASTVLISASHDRQSMGSGMGALSQLGGLASLAGINIGNQDSETDEALAVLRSRQFIQSFVDDNQLMPVLFFQKWDPDKKAWAVPAEQQPSAGDAYRLISKKIMVIEKDKRTELVTLSINWQHRSEAAKWANELVERLNKEMRERAIEKTNASLKHLEQELENTSEVGTRDAINRLVEVQIRQRMLANVNKEYIFRVVDRAVTPELKEKVKPQRMLLVGIGLLLGLVIGVSSVLLLERKPAFQ